MSAQSSTESVNPRLQEMMELRKCWIWFLILGIGLIVVGVMALGASFIATLATVTVFGALILAGGVIQIVNAVVARSWKGFFLHLLAGIIHLVLGGFMVEHPAWAAADLTFLLALAFLVGGAFRIITCLIERFPGWNWVLLNGVITFLLGILIWRQWPESSFWLIGTFVGIDLIFNGWSWVMLAMAVKVPPQPGAQI